MPYYLCHFAFAMLLVASLTAPSHAVGITSLASREFDLWPSAAAMGSVAATSTDPLGALWVNPAAIIHGAGQVGATHTEWVLDTRSEQLAVALGGGAKLRFGMSALVLTTGDIPLRRTEDGTPVPSTDPLGTFESRDFTSGLTAAYSATPDIAIGVTVRVLAQKIYLSDATTLAADAGAQWQFSERLRFGASVNNVGPALDWDGVKAPLPRSFRAGAACEPRAGLTIASEVWLLRDRETRAAVGLEWQPVNVLAVRTGYLLGSDSQSLSAGFGLNWRGVGFDYALAPLDNDLGTTHRAALRIIPSRLRPSRN